MAINGKSNQYRLPNGLVVALQRTPTETAFATLRVNYGSIHEKENEEGIAHFLEHCLVTGGSETYDPIIADNIRDSFGGYNAATSIGRTCFVGDMVKEDVEKWIEFVADHALRPRFDAVRVGGEKERVLREISDKKSSADYILVREFSSLFYRNHPKGRFNLGREEVVRNTDIHKLNEFHSRGFSPNNMDLIIAGGLPENLEEIIERCFGKFSTGENTRMTFPELADLERSHVRNYAMPGVHIENSQDVSAEISLSYKGPTVSSPDVYSVRTMNYILGVGANSRLFHNIGLKKGLAYNIQSSYDGEYNCGEMHISAKVPAIRIDESIEAIFEELDKMRKEKISEGTIEHIKRKSKYNVAKTFESNEGHVYAMGLSIDDRITPENYIEGYNQVTARSVLDAAQKYIPDKTDGKYILVIKNPLLK